MPLRCSHILVDTLEKAQEIRAQIKTVDDFQKLAKEHSKCPSSAVMGDLGPFPAGSMEESFETTLLALNFGEISDPVQTSSGFHILYRTE